MPEVVFVNTIVFVKDITVSTKFYAELLGLRIMNSYPTIVWFKNNFAIHDARALYNTIYKKDLPAAASRHGKDNMDIYFECNNLEELYHRLKQAGPLVMMVGIEAPSPFRRMAPSLPLPIGKMDIGKSIQ